MAECVVGFRNFQVYFFHHRKNIKLRLLNIKNEKVLSLWLPTLQQINVNESSFRKCAIYGQQYLPIICQFIIYNLKVISGVQVTSSPCVLFALTIDKED